MAQPYSGLQIDMREKKLLYIFIAALVLKLIVFAFISFHSPQSKFEADSPGYLEPGLTLIHKGVFARAVHETGPIFYERFRTPGYPLFLGILHGLLHIPLTAIVIL